MTSMGPNDNSPNDPRAGSSASSGSGSAFLSNVQLSDTTIDVEQEVAKARDDLRLGRIPEALNRLIRLTDAGAPTGTGPSGALGSAFTVLGHAYLASGDQAAARTAYDRAVSSLEAATDLSSQGQTDLGAALMATDRVPAALSVLEAARARQTEPNVETLRLLGLAYLASARKEDAEEAFRAAVAAAAPADGYLELMLATLAAELGRTDAADHYRTAVSVLIGGDDLPSLHSAVDGLLAQQPNDASAMAAKGEALRREGKLDEAIDWLRRSVGVTPDYAFAQASLGAALLASEEHADEALGHLDLALAESPGYAFAGYWQVIALRRLGRADDAVNAADALIESAGEMVDSLKVKALALQDGGRYDEAVAVLQRASEIAPDDGEIPGVLADVLAAKGSFVEALAAIDRANELLPDHPVVAGTRGKILLALNRPADAVEALTLAATAMPDDWTDDLAEALVQAGRGADALELVDRAIERQPANVTLIELKARVLTELKREDEAIEALEKAASVAPSVARYSDLSDRLRAAGRYVEALAAAKQAVDLDPDSAWAIGTRGQALAALDRRKDAMRDVTRAIELDDSLAWAHVQRARLFEADQRYDEAAEARRAVLRLRPDDGNVMLALGASLRIAGHFEEAEKLDREALAKGADSSAARLELIEVLVAAGKNETALQEADGALEEHPDSFRALQLKGQILVTMTQNEAALPILDMAIAVDPLDAWTFHLKAVALEALDRLTEALVASRQALALAPDDPVMRTELASILSSSGEWTEAAALFDDAEPSVWSGLDSAVSSWVAALRGTVFYYMRRPAESEAGFRLALEGNAGSIAHRLWLATAIRSGGRQAEGDAIVREVIDGAPTLSRLEPEDIANLGWAHNLLGEYDDAAHFLARALSKQPSLVWAQFDLALALLGGGAGDSGLREYERGIDQLRTYADPRRRHGVVAVALRDLEEAYPTTAEQRPRPPGAPAPEVETVRELLSVQLQTIANERDRLSATIGAAVS